MDYKEMHANAVNELETKGEAKWQKIKSKHVNDDMESEVSKAGQWDIKWSPPEPSE